MIELASQPQLDKASSIVGWMSVQELNWLAFRAQKCKSIVEFGSFYGRSTRALADNSPPNCKIYAVDTWNGDYNIDPVISTFILPIFKQNLDDHIRAGKVIPCRTWSSKFSLPEKVDLVFIDAGHFLLEVREDIKSALKLLKPNGIISGHDYCEDFPGVIQAVDEFFPNAQHEDTIWWTDKY